ncbi:hypothetical protein [Nostoc sp. TCL26-01]|uniref:hypothetical protein n=1 Tax=Nostoc sp. TCL26-01 TaxID=2576904 RepID=UPI0015BBFFF2|nr:hypothetical protein [Nostoc sp. TCL26-01]QLE55329.1 hypothetical protein FD725_07260 [Nostoc sp. TCL26-01]
MPLETVIGTSLNYYLIAFDADGKERDETGNLISQKLIDILSTEPITDVFFISHGWMGDVPAARNQYDRWIKAMADTQADIAKIQQVRPEFRPLLIGIHWPSKPWGDEKLTVSFDVTENSQENLIDSYAQNIADTEAAREALRTIFTAAVEYDAAPDSLPPEVRQAYEVLIKEASLTSEGEDIDTWSENEPLNLDPESIYQTSLAEQTENVSFGFGDNVKSAWDSFLNLPRLLSFWKMKERARKLGGTSGHNLLNRLQRVAADNVRFHLIGHSFGCIFVSATVAGSQKNSPLIRPVNSLVLIQGALSLWSFCPIIPHRKNLAGYFHPIIAQGKVAGPIVTTQSDYDSAIKLGYKITGNLGLLGGQDIDFHVGSVPKLPDVGGVGIFGIQGAGLNIENDVMRPLEETYNFQPRKIYNLDSSEYIFDPNADIFMGSHNAIDRPEVAHAVWSAAFGI